MLMVGAAVLPLVSAVGLAAATMAASGDMGVTLVVASSSAAVVFVASASASDCAPAYAPAPG